MKWVGLASKLRKTVARECLTSQWQGRPLISSLEPATAVEPERICLREKGRRHSFSLPLLTVYRLAAQDAADAACRVTKAQRGVNRGLLK